MTVVLEMAMVVDLVVMVMVVILMIVMGLVEDLDGDDDSRRWWAF